MDSQQIIHRIEENVQQVIKGKKSAIHIALIALIARGHLLIEDVPGVGKTLLAMTLAQSLGCTFKRIQFTSDLLPSDILGVSIFNQHKQDFEFKPGPIFTNILLADEINRTTPKTQSALLQAMNNAEISMDHHHYHLPKPFLVFATQNPIEYQGTYPLPEAQKDRFMLRLRMGYPSRKYEKLILSNGYLHHPHTVHPVVSLEELLLLQNEMETLYMEDSVMDYVMQMIEATRLHPEVKLGASTRGGLHLVAASKAHALLNGQKYVIPHDVKAVSVSVLAHRLILKNTPHDPASLSLRSDQIVEEILNTIPVPI